MSEESPPKLLLADGIGPFFRFTKRKRINWSKVPFSDLEKNGQLNPEYLDNIRADFRAYCQSVSRLGYTGITLDDVAHLVTDESYPPSMRVKLDGYRQLYKQLFAIAADEGLQVYVTTDVMFYNEALKRKLGPGWKSASDWLADAFATLFVEFPEVAGVIVRFGESDGLDVRGDFTSELILRHPHQARGFLSALLPTFEKHQRLLVFRTWSVGAHPWSPRNFPQKVHSRICRGSP